MKKKRFTIEELQVKSFVTQISETEQRTTKGGDIAFRFFRFQDNWTVEKSQFALPNKGLRRANRRQVSFERFNDLGD